MTDNTSQIPGADVQGFRAAYKSWKAAEDEYFERLLAIGRGEALADADFDRFCDELKAKHELYIELSKPFVRWR